MNELPRTTAIRLTWARGEASTSAAARTPETPPLPNPYRLSGRRDVIITAVQDLMRDRKLVVDEIASRLSDGIIVSQPYTFTKGAVVAEADLGRYADVPASSATRMDAGRYTLTVEIQPIDGIDCEHRS